MRAMSRDFRSPAARCPQLHSTHVLSKLHEAVCLTVEIHWCIKDQYVTVLKRAEDRED